jgi:transcriptional regulator with XRE-family HTH domain
MEITVLDELLSYIDPLTPDEYAALERSLLNEGCRDALVLWGDVLVDGHNRYGICRRHGLPFNTVQNPHFKSMDDVRLWMIDQHLGRRSVSDFQRGVLALRKKEILASREAPRPFGPSATPKPALMPASAQGAEQALTDAPAPASAPLGTPTYPGGLSASGSDAASSPVSAPEPALTREALAKAARISSNTISQIEKIQKSATPELVTAVKSGLISINAAATVSELPLQAQIAAVAGGKKELQQAARQVRAAKAVERTEPETPEGVIARLKQTIIELSAENVVLKLELSQLRSA